MNKNEDNLRIGSMNIHNNHVNRFGGIREDGIDNTELLANFINENDYDILGIQEATHAFSENLANKLSGFTKNFKMYGGYRWGNAKLLRKISFIEDFNENNAIITKLNVNKDETKHLPWIANNPKDLLESITKGAIMPRIATITEIDYKDYGTIYAINTHLDYQVKSIQYRQLKTLLKIITSLNTNNIVLTGDFNMEVKDELFQEFIKELEKLGIKRVPIDENTFHLNGQGKIIDCIFVPNTWEIVKSGLINKEEENIIGISDHESIYADVRIK